MNPELFMRVGIKPGSPRGRCCGPPGEWGEVWDVWEVGAGECSSLMFMRVGIKSPQGVLYGPLQ